MHNFYSLGAVCLGAASRILKSKIKETAAAVVVGVVGIGLLVSPFLVQANDEEEADKAPYVSCLWIANSGSIGFEVDFDVSVPWEEPWEEIHRFDKFQLWRDGIELADGSPRSDTLRSDYCDWLSIPGFDGSTSTAPIGSHSFDFTVKALKTVVIQLHPLGTPPPLVGFIKWETFWVDISLYVTVNSNGSLRSMYAYAYDGDGDFYEIPVYYSAGGWGGSFETF